MHFFLSAGEPSGDLHGSNLIRQLRQLHPQGTFSGFGGPKMQAAGCQLLFELTSLAVMFFDALLANYLKFRRLLRQADEYLRTHDVDAVIVIDYPGFNWHVARAAKRRGIPVIYYGAPQLWAWAPWRIKKLRRLADVVLCKLPFEPEWFQSRGVNAQFIGHPFFDETRQASIDSGFVQSWTNDSRPTLLLLPGSRDREVAQHWPILREAARACLQHIPHLRIAIGCFRESQAATVQSDLEQRGLPFSVFSGKTPELMHVTTVCLACSGSVSLELMERRVPTAIVYKLSPLNQILKRILLRCRFVTLVNLIACNDINRRGHRPYNPDDSRCEDVPMPEYLLTDDRTEDLSRRLCQWILDGRARSQRVAWLNRLAQQYAQPGASRLAAKIITSVVSRRGRISRLAA